MQLNKKEKKNNNNEINKNNKNEINKNNKNNKPILYTTGIRFASCFCEEAAERVALRIPGVAVWPEPEETVPSWALPLAHPPRHHGYLP